MFPIMPPVKNCYWSPKKRATAAVLRQEGYTYEAIAQRIGGGATKSGVRKVCLKFENYGKVTDLPKSGRRKVTTAHDDRQMTRMVMKDRRVSSKNISVALAESGVRVSARTVRDRLFKAGLRARTPRKKPFLNSKQRLKRVEWAKKHRSWSTEQWSRVIFSDESRISIFGSDGVKYIRRRSGEENLPSCLVPTMKHPISVMIWGCIARDGVGRLKVLDGIMNARKYTDDVLEAKLVRSAEAIFGPNYRHYIFQQDGAPCHTAKVCMKWFADNGITLLDWPGNSPDLNPIENLWARLKRLVAAKRPSNKRELIASIIASWHNTISPDDLKCLVDSMPRRCEAVIKAKGYPTKY